MKALLMYRDRDFDLERDLPWNEAALTQDLELDVLFDAMAQGDPFLFRVAKTAVLTAVENDLDTIRYRQSILQDCLKRPSVVRDLYKIASDTVDRMRKHQQGMFSDYPVSILAEAAVMLQALVDMLSKLRQIADEHAGEFESEGFTRLLGMLSRELGDGYLATIQDHLNALRFRDGVLISAELASGNVADDYVLRRSRENPQNWMRLIISGKPSAYSFRIDGRDDRGTRIVSDLENRGLNRVANALAQSATHILGFFTMLRLELAFYVGCLSLYEQLGQMGEPACFPLPVAPHERTHSFTGLYDACLALTMGRKVVGNDVSADGKDLVIITGANQGGKSTSLRSIGLAQLMMQSGMAVPAESFCANLCRGLYTHYRREEDATVDSGKLDEELGRMSAIVDSLTPDCMVLFNESFAATNEREGSQIARQVIGALVDRHIKVFFVTHLYLFAHGLYDRGMANAIFLRAEREPDGGRTFRISEGEPMQTSYGEDVYHSVFS